MTPKEELEALRRLAELEAKSGKSEDDLAKEAFNKAMNQGWGTGFPKFAYELGGKATDVASQAGLSPETAAKVGFGTNLTTQVLPSLLMSVKGLPGPSKGQEAHNAMMTQKGAVLEKGRSLGLKVPPSQANPSMINRTVESIGGKAATAQRASEVNQDVAYAIAQREAGLSPAEPIARETLKAARTKMAGPYRDIAALEAKGPLSKPPFKSPAKTLEELQEVRREAKNLWAYYNRSLKPSAMKEAKAASAKVDQLEQALEVHAREAGRPDLVEKLRQARMALAKNYTVERAMKGSTFDPAALSRLESRGTTPLSGDLEILMQMYRDFPKAMNAPQVGGSVGVNQLMPWLGGSAGGAAGAMLGGPAGAAIGAPAGVVLGQTLPPLARSLMLSTPYQHLMANPQMAGNPALMQGILANPALTGLLNRQ